MNRRGPVVLLANGFDDSWPVQSTPGLAEWMRDRKIRRVAHIGWATDGFPERHTHTNDIAIRRMEDAGFDVWDVKLGSFDPANALRNVDAIYLNGGNPGILRDRLCRTSCDFELRWMRKMGVPVLGASSGAIVLGSGALSLTSAFALKPAKGHFRRVAWGLGMRGMGMYPQALIPHRARQEYSPSMIRLVARLLRVPDLLFVPDGQMTVIE